MCVWTFPTGIALAPGLFPAVPVRRLNGRSPILAAKVGSQSAESVAAHSRQSLTPMTHFYECTSVLINLRCKFSLPSWAFLKHAGSSQASKTLQGKDQREVPWGKVVTKRRLGGGTFWGAPLSVLALLISRRKATNRLSLLSIFTSLHKPLQPHTVKPTQAQCPHVLRLMTQIQHKCLADLPAPLVGTSNSTGFQIREHVCVCMHAHAQTHTCIHRHVHTLFYDEQSQTLESVGKGGKREEDYCLSWWQPQQKAI